MKIEIRGNKNYCASIVKIERLIPIEGADSIVATPIFSNSVIVGKDTQIGTLGVYFPLECSISKDFLAVNNLLRDKEQNKDKDKTGFFEETGRVKALKLRGQKSEGFFIPLAGLKNYLPSINLEELPVGTDFDTIDGKTICKKYVTPTQYSKNEHLEKNNNKKPINRESRIVDGQFTLHIDTENLKKNMYKLNPDDVVSISKKYHGTSFVVANILTRKKSNFLQKFFHLDPGTDYGLMHSSRRVIKDRYFENEKNNQNHFYGYDLWDEIADELKFCIPKGYTLYGEAVGFLRNGEAIQAIKGKPYCYEAKENHYRLFIYRITYTSPQGHTIEFTWGQIKDFCKKNGLEYPKEYFYGRLKDFYSDIKIDASWHENFLSRLIDDKNINMGDVYCEMNPGLPAEGIVLKRDSLFVDEVWKLKNFKFLSSESSELDTGSSNIEDQGNE